MFIRYRIEPTGKKHGWAQGGSDCWYYSAKSLLRFYGLVNTKNDQLWAHLQIAKLIRVFINEMRKIHGKNFHHPMLANSNIRKWLDDEVRHIEQTRANVVQIALADPLLRSSVEPLLPDQANLWTTERIAKLSLIAKELEGYLGPSDYEDITAKRYTFLQIGKMAFRHYEDGKIWDTSAIFNSAFPKGTFEAVILPARTPEDLYKALVEHGPLWTTGQLHAIDKAEYTIITHGEKPEDDIRKDLVTVFEYKEGSSHAVCVYGVNLDSRMIEYADPHDFTTPRRVQANIFFRHVARFEFNNEGQSFLKVNAPNGEGMRKLKRLTEW